MRTRIAPTPSGFLHEGNAVNFALITAIADQHGFQVALRIDDMDAARIRPEYVDDIFDTLNWLDISIVHGPRDREEFERTFSTRYRRQEYWQHAHSLVLSGGAFVCECSRADRLPDGRSGCIRDCRHHGFTFSPGANAIKVRIEDDDIVIWRRDDLPAYHLACVVDDVRDATTHIIRGADLQESTRVQVALAHLLGLDSFAQSTFWHHPLIVDDNGTKLSKSQLGTGPMTRDADSLNRIRATATRLIDEMDLN